MENTLSHNRTVSLSMPRGSGRRRTRSKSNCCRTLPCRPRSLAPRYCATPDHLGSRLHVFSTAAAPQQPIAEVVFDFTLCRTVHTDQDRQAYVTVTDVSTNRLELSAEWRAVVRQFISIAHFIVYYYTKCALLKAGCYTLKIHVCTIKICMVRFREFSICQFS